MSSLRENFIIYTLGAGAMIALGIFGWQIYGYLMDGVWTPMSIITALNWAGVEWAAYPDSWVGVHKILDSFSLAITVFLVSLASLLIWKD